MGFEMAVAIEYSLVNSWHDGRCSSCKTGKHKVKFSESAGNYSEVALNVLSDDQPRSFECSDSSYIATIERRVLRKSDFDLIGKVDTILSVTSSISSLLKYDLGKRFTLGQDFYSIILSARDFKNSNFKNITGNFLGSDSVCLNLYYLIESITIFSVSFFDCPIKFAGISIKHSFKMIDRTIHIIKGTIKLSKGQKIQKVLYNCCKISKDILCVVALFGTTAQVSVAIFALGFLISSIKSYHRIQREEYLDTLDTVLGSFVDMQDFLEMSKDEEDRDISENQVVDEVSFSQEKAVS